MVGIPTDHMNLQCTKTYLESNVVLIIPLKILINHTMFFVCLFVFCFFLRGGMSHGPLTVLQLAVAPFTNMV